MLSIKAAMKSERLMRATTGMSIKQFSELLPAFLLNLADSFISNRGINPCRGRKFILPIEQQLFFILFYLKCYPTFDVAAFFYGVDKASCCRWVQWFLPALESTLGAKQVLPKRKVADIKDLFDLVPETKELYVDGTERPRRRPKDNEKQKQYYSGKKKRHTFKNIIVSNQDKKILVVSPTSEGKVHDYKSFKDDDMGNDLPPEIPVFLDNGFQGIKTDFPLLNVFMPKRKPKGKELSEDEKQGNTSISKKRILIEHVMAGIKRLGCTAQVFRNIKSGLEDSMMLTAAGLWNFNLQTK